MNIVSVDVSLFVAAKMCDCNQAHGRGRKVTYEFIDDYYSTCIDKRDVIIAQLQACEKLLNYSKDENDKSVIRTEMEELKMILDLISQ
jgi:hypothetical protein